MVKSDSIYQVLLKYDFDLFRQDKGITEYMAEHLRQYYTDIVAATESKNDFLGDNFISLLKNKLNCVDYVCKEIPNILSDFDDGHIKDAYIKSCSLFEKMKPYLLSRFSWSGDCGTFYRIRQGDFRITNPSRSKEQKAELFHIKKRNAQQNWRISI